jgi:zinc transport system permease protein
MIIAMMDDFLWRAILAGCGVALAAGPLGCFVVWRRMAYFGDGIAHAGLLGVALGLVLGIDPELGVLAVGLALAFLLARLERSSGLAADTLLGIFSHAGLAFGLLSLALLSGTRVDLNAYLFGDILSVDIIDLIRMWGGGLAVLGLIVRNWDGLLAMVVDEDLARVDGVKVERLKLLLVLLLALITTVAIKAVGVLLVTALLIIPAAAARGRSSSPEGMAIRAVIIGMLAVGLGIGASFLVDLPAGPAIVAAAVLLFAVFYRSGR